MYHIIANPHAGGGKAAKKIDRLERYLQASGIPYRVYFTEYKNHAEQIARELARENAGIIVSAGGDGTLHEILNGIENLSAVKIGILPFGTGNDFAKPLGIPADPVKAFQVIKRGNTKKTDLMLVGGRRAICFATSGIDLALVEACNTLKKKRPSSYLRMLLRELKRDKTYSFDIDYDGKKERFDTFFAGFTSNGVIASGMKLCPGASPFDGLLDLVVMRKMKRRYFPRLLVNLYKGNVLSRKNVVHLQGKYFCLTPLTMDAVDLDGELYYNHPFDVSILEGAVSVFY